MPVRYFINPELNIILFIGEGLLTGSEYFKAAETASHEKLRKWGMVTIVDVLTIETDFEVQDMKYAIEFANKLPQQGLEPEPIVVLTNSKGIQIIADTIKLLPSKVAIKFDVFNTIDDAISFLGFSEKKQEFISFYNLCKSRN